MNIGPTEALLIVSGLILWIVPIWAIVDAARRPDDAFASRGQSRTTWIILLVVTALFCGPIGLFFSLYYLVAVRPKLGSGSGG